MEETPVYVSSRRHNIDEVKELNQLARQQIPDDITHVLIDGNKESHNTLEMQNEVGREIYEHIQSNEKLLEVSNIVYFGGDATSIDQHDGLDVIFTGNKKVIDVILENISILGKKNVIVVTKGISIARTLADEGINFMFYDVFIGDDANSDDGHVDRNEENEQKHGQVGQRPGHGRNNRRRRRTIFDKLFSFGRKK